MRIGFRQGVVSHQAGGFLQITGGVVNLLADTRPVTVTVAHLTTNYTHSEDTSVSNAWVGPFIAPIYWLFWDFNPTTFVRTFEHTTIEPIAQSAVPGSGDAAIISFIPGGVGIGSFIVNQFYNLQIGRIFNVNGSTLHDGLYTVRSISYNSTSGETTIGVDELVVGGVGSPIVGDGFATLDIDSQGIPLLVDGRHWFDTASNNHFLRILGIWTPVLRVFAGTVQSGTTLASFSDNASIGDFTGTQIGNNLSVFSGRILFDESTNTIRRSNGTFFTTEDHFFTNQARIDSLRLESNNATARCVPAALAEFSIVSWVSDGEINAAQYDDIGNTVLGLLLEDLVTLQVGAVLIQGVVTNPQWDWITAAVGAVPVGAPLWVENGILATVDPFLANPTLNPVQAVPIARVLSDDTVIFEQGLGGVGPQGAAGTGIGGLPVSNTTDLGAVTLVSPSSDPLRAFVISDLDPRLTDARVPLAHTHQALNILFTVGGGLSSNNTQDALVELGNTKLSLIGGTMGGFLTLNADPTLPLHAATRQYVDGVVGGVGALLNVVEDLTPQLGGDLDVNSSDIISTGGANINILPDGVGHVVLGNLEIDSNQSLVGVDGFVMTYDSGTGFVSLEATAVSGLLNVVEDLTPQLGGDLDVNSNDIVSTSNENINILPNGLGHVVLGNLEIDSNQSLVGVDGFVMTYDSGTGFVSLEAGAGGGLGNIVEDLTPQLGGDLDVNSSDIVSTGGANINILPDGVGNVVLGTMALDSDQAIGIGQDNYVLTYNDATSLISLEAPAYVPLGLNEQPGAAYQLVAADVGNMIFMSNAAANTVTIPNDTSAIIALGSEINIQQTNTGVTTIAPEAPVTINSAGGFLNIVGQYDAVSCVKVGANEWTIIGNLN